MTEIHKAEIHKRALHLREELRSEIEYVEDCLSSAICPTCGKNLVCCSTHKELGDFTKIVCIVCSDGHALIHPIHGDRS